MTDIERLRDDLEMLAEHPFNAECCNASFPIAALRRACQESIAILADYERLRGMEERLGADLQCLVNGETPDGDGVTVNVSLWAEKWIERLLVPVPSGEGKDG